MDETRTKRPFNAGRNLYNLFRKQPPERREASHVIAYWNGYDGVPSRHTPTSYAWWAFKAGKDNRAAGDKAKA
jgi:hypothetical protein